MSDFTQEIITTLVLRSDWRAENIRYIVEIEDKKTIHHCFMSENYNQALLVARKIFEKLDDRKNDLGDFAIMVEHPQGKGISYDINAFPHSSSFDDTEAFYSDLANEFEHQKLVSNLDNNTLFRQFVNKNKLNEYQELRFLKLLKELWSEEKSS